MLPHVLLQEYYSASSHLARWSRSLPDSYGLTFIYNPVGATRQRLSPGRVVHEQISMIQVYSR